MPPKRFFKRLRGSLSWPLLPTGFIAIAILLLLGLSTPAHADITLEAEQATRTGVSVTTAVAGYSGSGYVTGFDATGDRVSWNFNATNGLYKLLIRFRSQFGEKGFVATLNGVGASGMFPQATSFATFDTGLVELTNGVNRLQIGGGWNYYEIDRTDFVTVPPPAPPLPVPASLVDPQATFAARMLHQALVKDYGKTTWAGQQDAGEVAYIQNVSGRKPVIVSGDLIEYSPTRVQYGGMPANYTESLIALENAGHVLALAWHWNAPTNLLNTAEQPWWRGFYTEATTFNFATALANPNSPEYAMLLRDMDAIAVQLKKIAGTSIPVLWRPLHEVEGGWFWWGARGPEPFKQLWRLLFNRLTQHHGLHNLIWVLTSEDPAWYPGDDVVDVLGVDGYPDDRADVLSPRWEALKARFDGKKLIALTEFGGVPDIERMQRFGVWWSWFAPWTGTYGPTSMPTNTVARIYQLPTVTTLEELNAVPPQLLSLTLLDSGARQLQGTGPRGAVSRLLTSPNPASPIAEWSPMATGRFAGGMFTFVDETTNQPQRFYRVMKP